MTTHTHTHIRARRAIMPPSCSDKHSPCTGREREAGPEENKKRNNARSTSLHMSAQPQQCTSKETCGRCEGEARERMGKARRSDEGVADTHVPPNTWSPLFPYSLPPRVIITRRVRGWGTHTQETHRQTRSHTRHHHHHKSYCMTPVPSHATTAASLYSAPLLPFGLLSWLLLS